MKYPALPSPLPHGSRQSSSEPRCSNQQPRRVLLGWFASLAALAFASSVQASDALEPEAQKEADWIDARWSKTDLGNFHASVVSFGKASVAKGLSIRVGEKGEGAMLYDLSSASLRAGWTGGFLTFNGARYGLIHAPKPAGEVLFSAPAAAWNPGSVRWRGWRVHGPRLVLEYEVAGIRITESPWLETSEDLPVLTRTIEFDATTQPVSLTLVSGKDDQFTLKSVEGVNLAMINNGAQSLMIALTGDMSADLRWLDGALKLQLPAGPNKRRVKLFIGSRPAADGTRMAALVKRSPQPENLAPLSEPGPSRWQALTNRGQRGFGNDSYVIDTLTVPYENPWKALFFTSGVDFLPNGDAAVCTIHGDVWLVSGIDDKLEKLTWRRFATGLHQPLGLRVRDGKVFVLGRDQITRLHDENGDGEADFYENFYSGIQTSAGGHDYVASLEKDTSGNFYYVDPRGAHRVSADGSKGELIASGWRNPNGMGASPDGKILTVAPQEGEWTPSSAIAEVRPKGWYGYGGPKVAEDRPLGYDSPLCWIPHEIDNSGGSQLWVTSDRWGPLNGQLLHFSFGRCSHFLVLRDVVDGVAQGAIASLPGKFLSGAMRGAFNPRDGQLYVVGSRGWQTSAARDGCLQRVRYTGKVPLLPVEWHAHSNGLRLTFTAPLDKATAEDVGSYALSQWNYRYAARYGSKDYSVTNPDKEGHDSVEVRSAKLLSDQKTVFLEVPGLRPVMQWELKYSLNSAEGKTVKSRLHGSINRPATEFRP